LALITGRLHVGRLELEQPYVDLGAPGGGGGGLLDLFQSETSTPAAEPQSREQAGLRIELADLRIARGRAGATLGRVRFALHEIAFRGEVDVGTEFALRVSELSAELRRNDQPIGSITQAQGERGEHGDAKLKLAADLSGATLRVDAKLERAKGAQPQ